MVNEPDEKDILFEDEYKAATAKWRTKQFIKSALLIQPAISQPALQFRPLPNASYHHREYLYR